MNYPVHLGIIPDGCRRWAIEKKLPPWEGHSKGIEVMEEIGKWSLRELPIKYYTIYGLSTENLNRPKMELEVLGKLYSKHFLRLAKDKEVHDNEVNIGMIGRIDLLPKKLQEAIGEAEIATKDYDNKFFRIALAYGGRQEIIDSVKRIVEKEEPVTMDSINANLYSNVPEPDFILRSAERRLSNFLLWQSAYTELYFSKKYWPDTTLEDYKTALADYDNRKRRYGK